MEGISDFINAPWISEVKILKFVSYFDQIEPMLDFVKSTLQIQDSEAILFVNIHSPTSNHILWPEKSEVVWLSWTVLSGFSKLTFGGGCILSSSQCPDNLLLSWLNLTSGAWLSVLFWIPLHCTNQELLAHHADLSWFYSLHPLGLNCCIYLVCFNFICI